MTKIEEIMESHIEKSKMIRDFWVEKGLDMALTKKEIEDCERELEIFRGIGANIAIESMKHEEDGQEEIGIKQLERDNKE